MPDGDTGSSSLNVDPAVDGSENVDPAVDGSENVDPAVDGSENVDSAVGGSEIVDPAVAGSEIDDSAVGGPDVLTRLLDITQEIRDRANGVGHRLAGMENQMNFDRVGALRVAKQELIRLIEMRKRFEVERGALERERRNLSSVGDRVKGEDSDAVTSLREIDVAIKQLPAGYSLIQQDINGLLDNYPELLHEKGNIEREVSLRSLEERERIFFEETIPRIFSQTMPDSIIPENFKELDLAIEELQASKERERLALVEKNSRGQRFRASYAPRGKDYRGAGNASIEIRSLINWFSCHDAPSPGDIEGLIKSLNRAIKMPYSHQVHPDKEFVEHVLRDISHVFGDTISNHQDRRGEREIAEEKVRALAEPIKRGIEHVFKSHIADLIDDLASEILAIFPDGRGVCMPHENLRSRTSLTRIGLLNRIRNSNLIEGCLIPELRRLAKEIEAKYPDELIEIVREALIEDIKESSFRTRDTDPAIDVEGGI